MVDAHRRIAAAESVDAVLDSVGGKVFEGCRRSVLCDGVALQVKSAGMGNCRK